MILDAGVWRDSLPSTIEAIFATPWCSEQQLAEVRAVRASFLAHFGLDDGAVPLVLLAARRWSDFLFVEIT